MSKKRKPIFAFWAAITIVGLAILYPMSYGPVLCIEKCVWKFQSREQVVSLYEVTVRFYAPALAAVRVMPEPLQDAYWWFVSLWTHVDRFTDPRPVPF